jgi:hypothetical protein
MQIDYNEILSSEGLNSLIFGDPYAKLCFTSLLVKSALRYYQSKKLEKSSLQHEQEKQNQNPQGKKKRVIYLDCDTMFAAYLSAGFLFDLSNRDSSTANINDNAVSNNKHRGSSELASNNKNVIRRSEERNSKLIDIYLPSEGRFESLLGDIIASMPEASLVIFDSLNGFYNMYPTKVNPESSSKKSQGAGKKGATQIGYNKKDENTEWKAEPILAPGASSITGYTIGQLNHLLSVFIMLLVKHGVSLGVPVLVTSMVRYRKVSEDLWVKSPACRRLLHQKSVVRLSVEISEESNLSVNIIKHPFLEQQSVIFPNAGIQLSTL